MTIVYVADDMVAKKTAEKGCVKGTSVFESSSFLRVYSLEAQVS
jgi:hypothetical protein